VIQQVLTPLEESSLMGTPFADPNSIMCYQIPGEITKDGEPILGGVDIDHLDFDFAAKIYPKPATALRTTASTAQPTMVDLESPTGWRIRVPQRMDGDSLRALLNAIGA